MPRTSTRGPAADPATGGGFAAPAPRPTQPLGHTALTDLRDRLDVHHRLAARESSRSLDRYFHYLLIDAGGTARRFADVADPWQWDRFRLLTPAVEYLAGVRECHLGPKYYWQEWPRGCAKTAAIASLYNWLLCYARRPLRLFAAAADRDQARLVRNAMEAEYRLNAAWLPPLRFANYAVSGPGGTVEILASDAPSAQGKTPDGIVFDEVTVWPRRDLWDALISTAAKKLNTFVLTITNAGRKGSWQHDLRRQVEADAAGPAPLWHFHAHAGPHPASWMSPAAVAAVRATMAPAEAARLYDGRWVDPAEDCGYLRPEDVDACVGAPRPAPRGATVYVGVDYGGVHDRTALAAGHYDGDRFHVTELEAWQGRPGDEVPLAAVEAWLRRVWAARPDAVFVFDPYQTLALIQALEAEGAAVRRFEFRSPKKAFQLAENLRVLVSNRRLVFPPAAGRLGADDLAAELKGLLTKPTSYGYRFDHAGGGFSDRAVAVALAAFHAVADAAGPAPAQAAAPPPEPPADPVRRLFLLPDHAARRGLFGLGRPG